MSSGDRRTGRSPPGAWGWALGWLALGIVNAMLARAALADADLLTRAWFHAFDLSHFCVLALVSVGASMLAARIGPGRAGVATLASTAIVALLVGALVLPADLEGPARRMQARTGVGGWMPWLVVATASIVPLAELTGRVLARRRLEWLAVTLAIGAATLAELFLVDLLSMLHRHSGARLYFAWASAAAIAGALACWQAHRITTDRRWKLAVVAVAAISFVPMPERVRATMVRCDGSVLFPFVTLPHGREVSSWRPEVAPSGPWYEPGPPGEDVPPSEVDRLDDPPIVLLLTIDAVRADVLDAPDAAARLPALTALRADAFDLSQARAPSTRTATVLSSLFASKYFSQLYWSERDGPRGPEPWPHEDPSTRFPARLSAHGVDTEVFAANPWLTHEFGAVAGFSREVVVEPRGGSVGPPGTAWASAREVTDAIVDRLHELAGRPAAPTFLYAHYLDPHDPYDSADDPADDSGGAEKDRYIAEIGRVDAGIHRLRTELTVLGLEGRTILVVTADHGEAFGEHHSWRHGTTLYDETLRVPLLIHVPGATPRRVSTPVSLVDLGPTILDLFGLPTPGAFMGGTLLPLLVEHGPAPTRPLAFEAGYKQALLLEDGTKIVRDLRYGVIEAFHLPSDPGERRNLFDGLGGEHDEALAKLATFFAVHELKRPGYALPRR